MENVIVGVDVSQDKFTAASGWQKEISEQGEWQNCRSECRAFCEKMEQVVRQVGANQIHLIIEPTGGYEAQLVAEAYRRNWLVTQVNPLDVSLWSRALGKRAKTDRQDARMLTRFGLEQHPAPQRLLADAPAELEQLLHRQTDLEHSLQAERNRLKQVHFHPRLAKTVQLSIEQIIQTFERELKSIQKAIASLIAQHADLARHYQHLLSVPAIGKKNAPHLLLACYRFQARTDGLGTPKQFSAYLGLDPAPSESGKTVYKRTTISRKGNPLLRSKLFCGALGGVRGKNPLNAFYQSLLARSKPKKVALVACARKTATWAWAVFIHDTPFDSSRLISSLGSSPI